MVSVMSELPRVNDAIREDSPYTSDHGNQDNQAYRANHGSRSKSRLQSQVLMLLCQVVVLKSLRGFQFWEVKKIIKVATVICKTRTV